MPSGQKAGSGEFPSDLNDLFNIGEAVKSALNAFGVNVDIEVDPETTAEKNRKEKEQDKDCKHAENSKETNDSKKAKDVQDSKASEESKITKEAKDLKDSMNSKDKESNNSKDSKPKDLGAACLGAINKKPLEDNKKENDEWTILDDKSDKTSEPLYRNLGSLNPKVQIAVQAMENMGFNNQGGWLTDLLERNDGNIGKVLDLLAPAKQA